MTGHDWQDPEAPEADATEQSLPIDPDEDEDQGGSGAMNVLPDDADEGDAVEQSQTVPPEDEYRD